MSKKKILIDYTGRDFDKIKSNLEQHAIQYYPDSYRDFSENSFGSFILDTVSYVGDMLSFYIDYQVNESFLETAIEYDNVRKLASNQGYDFYSKPPAFTICSFFIRVPSNTSGLGPNSLYLPILERGSEFSSDSGVNFVLTENVDFSDPNNDIVASKFSETTGKPTEYAVRAFGQVKSISLFRKVVDVGSFEKFKRVLVGPSYINQIKSVIDSEGHEYYQVDNLCQDTVYVNTTNPNAMNDGVPEIIKPKIVPRRFVVDQDSTGTFLQFGYGSDNEEGLEDILDPSQVSLKMEGRHYNTDKSFDPTKLLGTNTLGISPSNTTLTILYFANIDDVINLGPGQINGVTNVSFIFPPAATNSINRESVRSSLELTNDEPVSYDTSLPTAEEIKYRTYAAKAAQSRAVTRNDYEAFCYMMPASLGSVKRASIVNDPSSSNRRLSLYVISENFNKILVNTNATTKQNLKQWLSKNKMLNDNIDIYDAKIVNIGFDYEIIVDPTKDKVDVLNAVNNALREELAEKMYIGEPFYLTKIFNIVNKIDGVIDTTKVVPKLKTGSNYSSSYVGMYDIKSKDGTYLKAPRNVIFEIKYFDSDVRGAAV